eukprot:484654_1
MAEQPDDEEKYASHPKSSKRLSMEGALKAARISLEQYVNPKRLNKDKLIPKKILKDAKGIVFLTCIKAGFLFAANIGIGCVIVRQKNVSSKDTNNTITGWSPPSAIGVAGLSFGFLAGGAKVDYTFILNDDFAIKQFTGAGQLRLGGEVQLALGPVGRDADATVGVGDGGVSAIYSYSHTEGLYGGLELKGKIITVRPKTNAKFYNIKKVKCGDILSGYIPMPTNEDYNRIIHLLDTYCLDHIFPQQIEQKVDVEAMMELNDVNIENAINNLHSIFIDIDSDVIRIVLMEQCWGDIQHATDILLKMSNDNNKSKHSIECKIEEVDCDFIKQDIKPTDSNKLLEIQEIANKVKHGVINQATIQKYEKGIKNYKVLNGRIISKAVESYQIEIQKTESNNKQSVIETVCDIKYRIKIDLGENTICEILVEKTNPPLKYELLHVEFGLENYTKHDKEEKEEILQEPQFKEFSSNKLKQLARSNTKKHIELSDDDIDYENFQMMILNDDDIENQNNRPIVSNIGNCNQSVAILDGLVKSFEKN